MKFRALRAQVAAETRMTLQRGETLLVTLGNPRSAPRLLHAGARPGDGYSPSCRLLAPGVLALAVMSTAMVSLGIATAFERSYGVLKRLGATPLGRPVLLTAKIASVIVVEIIQVVLLVGVALALGWRPHPSAGLAVIAVLLATIAFAGIGLAMAGALRAEVTLAVANGVYVILLLIGGVIFRCMSLGVWPLSLACSRQQHCRTRCTARSDPARAQPKPGSCSLSGRLHAPVVAAVTFKWSEDGRPVPTVSVVADDHVDRHRHEDHGDVGDRVREQAHGAFRCPVLATQAQGVCEVKAAGEGGRYPIDPPRVIDDTEHEGRGDQRQRSTR